MNGHATRWGALLGVCLLGWSTVGFAGALPKERCGEIANSSIRDKRLYVNECEAYAGWLDRECEGVPETHQEICQVAVDARRLTGLTSSYCNGLDRYEKVWCHSLRTEKCQSGLSTTDKAACALFFPVAQDDEEEAQAPAGTIAQPRTGQGKQLCSLYAPANALQLVEGDDWDDTKCEVTNQIIAENGSRLGGNPQKLYSEFYKRVYGVRATQYEPAKNRWAKALPMAVKMKVPVSLGVEWKRGSKGGNHWVYFSTMANGSVIARDQQNNNLEITIDPKTWTGTAPGGWTYKVTKLSMGVTSDNYYQISQALK